MTQHLAAPSASHARLDRALLLAPLPGAEPCGPSVRHTGLYEQLRELTRWQVGDPAFGIPDKTPDWSAAEALAHHTLTTTSRDLYVAIVYAEAAAHVRGPAGMADGVFAISTLNTHYATHFHPQPANGNLAARARLIPLLMRKLDAILSAWSSAPSLLGPSSADPLREAEAGLRQLSEITTAYGDLGLSLNPLADRIAQITAGLDRPTTAGDHEAAQAPSGIAPAAPPPVACPTARVAASAGPGPGAGPTDPTTYLIPRWSRWLTLNADTQPGSLPAPDPASLARLEQLLAETRWGDLLTAAEAAFTQSPGGLVWLDLQRLTAAALRMLGPDYAAARTAVVTSLGDLLRRCPWLAAATAGDGTPFANQVTRTWIDDEVLGAAGPAQTDGTRLVQPTSEDRDVAHARAEFLAGRRDAALACLRAALHATTAGRPRYLRQRALAELHLDAGQPLAAAGLLHPLVHAGRTSDLTTWEGAAFVAPTLELLGRAYAELRALGHDSNALAARSFDVAEQLAGLDALRVAGPDRPATSPRLEP